MNAALLLSALVAAAAAAEAPYYIVLTDPHMDNTYEEGSAVSCATGVVGLPCCHSGDIGSGKAGPYGEAKCDVSFRFWGALLNAIKAKHPKPDMIMFLGDATPHTVVTATDSFVMETYTEILTEINRTFPGVPVYPLQGNHDTYPCNELRAKARTGIVKSLGELWASFNYVNGEEESKTMFDWLYYTRVHRPGHRVVGINSLWTYGSNSLLSKSDEDPAGMRAWLEETVANAAAAGEKVWLFGHIRPIGGNNHAEWVQWFTDLLAKYPGVIVRQHYGHSHTDELHIIRPAYAENATTVCFVHPAVTTFEGIWPSVRVGHWDESTMEETDITTYHVDITASNQARQVQLLRYYSHAEEYGMPDLTQQSWNELSERMLSDEATAAKYLKLKETDPNEATPSCDEDCRKELYCTMNYMPEALKNQCLENPK